VYLSLQTTEVDQHLYMFRVLWYFDLPETEISMNVAITTADNCCMYK